MAGSRYEKILGAEWLVVFFVETADALVGVGTPKWSGETKSGVTSPDGSPGFKLPDPAQYFAMMLVYLMLAAVAMFGDKAGKLAAAFGGVAALAIAISPSKVTGKPIILSLTTYFNQLLTGNTQGQAADVTGLPPGYFNIPATALTPGVSVAPKPAGFGAGTGSPGPPSTGGPGTRAGAPGGFLGR